MTKRIDRLKAELASTPGTLHDLKTIASSLNLMEDRYMARPAAELLVARGDAGASELAAGLTATPVLGRDPSGDLLRAAFKKAMTSEGVPGDVETMARNFYQYRGRKSGGGRGVAPAATAPQAQPQPQAQPGEFIGSTDPAGGLIAALRRLLKI